MDVCKIETLGALQKEAPADTTPRPPLVPSEKNNAVPAAARKPRGREVSSRYKSGISSAPASAPSTPRRCPSPTASRVSPAPAPLQPKRAQSAERRRPTTPTSRFSAPSSPISRPSTPSSPFSRSTSSRSTTPVRDTVSEAHNSARRLLSSRTPDGLWPSIRSPSSFQLESVSVLASKREKVVVNTSLDERTKATCNAAPERKRTPLRGRNTSDQFENSRPPEKMNVKVIDQHRWPAMLGCRTNGLSRSLDLTDKVIRSVSSVVTPRGVSPKRIGSASEGGSAGLQQSLSNVARILAIDGSRRVEQDLKSSFSSQASERSSSATRSSRIQSLPNSGLQRPSSPNRALSTPSSTFRGMLSPLRTRPSTPISSSSSGTNRAGASSSVLNYIVDGALSTPSSTFRGMLSPSRTRPSTPISSSSSGTNRAVASSSVLNYIVDVQKGKKNANQIEDAHLLRLLYSANLQWRFVNAQADDTFSIQKMRTENVLYGVWNSTSRLHASVIIKKIDVQHLRQDMKLNMILKEQMAYLEQWVTLEREHSSCLSGAVEALRGSTLRLPVTRGARADVLAVKNAVSSAVDVMRAMGSSICYLLSKVEAAKMLATELSFVAAKEKSMLDECRELLASAAGMQVQESSLRTHLMQLKQDACKLK